MADCFSLQSIKYILEDLRAIEAYGEMPISSCEAGNYADAIEQLLAENAKLKAERDEYKQKYLSSEVDATNLTGLLVQAVADLKISSDCDFCKYNTDNQVYCEKSPRGDECMGKRWEWRGVTDTNVGSKKEGEDAAD